MLPSIEVVGIMIDITNISTLSWKVEIAIF